MLSKLISYHKLTWAYKFF